MKIKKTDKIKVYLSYKTIIKHCKKCIVGKCEVCILSTLKKILKRNKRCKHYKY